MIRPSNDSKNKMERLNKANSGVELLGCPVIKNSKERFQKLGLQPLKNKSSVEQLLRRPEVNWSMLETLYVEDPIPNYSHEVIEQIVTLTSNMQGIYNVKRVG